LTSIEGQFLLTSARLYRTMDDELRRALLAFREPYNVTWLVERHDFGPSLSIRDE
jgi:hypothetical protein